MKYVAEYAGRGHEHAVEIFSLDMQFFNASFGMPRDNLFALLTSILL